MLVPPNLTIAKHERGARSSQPQKMVKPPRFYLVHVRMVGDSGSTSLVGKIHDLNSLWDQSGDDNRRVIAHAIAPEFWMDGYSYYTPASAHFRDVGVICIEVMRDDIFVKSALEAQYNMGFPDWKTMTRRDFKYEQEVCYITVYAARNSADTGAIASYLRGLPDA